MPEPDEQWSAFAVSVAPTNDNMAATAQIVTTFFIAQTPKGGHLFAGFY
jgi:hypothetical protein